MSQLINERRLWIGLIWAGILMSFPYLLRNGIHNRDALWGRANALSRVDVDFRDQPSLLPIQAIVLYVPYLRRIGSPTEALFDWQRQFRSGNLKDVRNLLCRSPAYSLEIVTEEWTLLGYDIMSEMRIIRLYWLSNRISADADLFFDVNRDEYILSVGQRLYQDIFISPQSAGRSVSGPSKKSWYSCPNAKSVLANLSAWEALKKVDWDEVRFYTVPVNFEHQACYFGLVWRGQNELNMELDRQIIATDESGAWVLITKQLPYLPAQLPFWDFMAFPVTLGWRGSPKNVPTQVEPTDDGLRVSSLGRDPIVISPEVRIDAKQAQRLVVKLRAEGTGYIQLFWSTREHPGFYEQLSSAQQVNMDGSWQTYEFDLTTESEWRGVITRLRIDPMSWSGVADVAYITVE